jgi:hypothetical protein
MFSCNAAAGRHFLFQIASTPERSVAFQAGGKRLLHPYKNNVYLIFFLRPHFVGVSFMQLFAPFGDEP